MELRLTPIQIALIALALLAVNFLAAWLVAPGTGFATLMTSVITILFALFAVLSLLRMRRFLFNVNSKWAKYLTYVAIGFTLWLLAENVWAYYAIETTRGVPGVTIADTAWFAGYLLIIYGLAKANRRTLVTFKLRHTLYAAMMALFALCVIAFVLLPMLGTPASPVEKFFSLIYPLFDIVIAALALRLAMALLGSPLGIAWAIFLLGFLVMAGSDAWYAYLTLSNSYAVGHISDYAYSSAYLFIAAGALLFEAMSHAGHAEAGKGYNAVENAYAQLKGMLMQKKGEDEVSITTAVSSPVADLAVIKLLAKTKGMGGVFLCLDRPHTYFVDQLKDLGVERSSVHFVAIGNASGDAQENVSFIKSAADLTTIKMTVMDAVREMKKSHDKVFVLVDCIPTLSLYSDLNQLGRFLHDVNLALRKEGAYQVMLLAPQGEINTFVFRFCDTNISLA